MATDATAATTWVLFTNEIPLDTLKKGQFIPPEIVERVACMERSEYSFRFRMLELRQRIQDHFEANGMTVTVCCDGFGLKILTDAEAAEYNAEAFKRRLRGTFEAHRRMMGLDAAALDAGQREAYDRKIIAQGRIIQSISTTNEQVRLLPYQRRD